MYRIRTVVADQAHHPVGDVVAAAAEPDALRRDLAGAAAVLEGEPSTTSPRRLRAPCPPDTTRHPPYTLFDALAIGGAPPRKPIEFGKVLKEVLSERFRILVCDEAQWM
ncbi:hypothetical protein IU427_24285 [Nocardia beijingensis]|uniref:hypothetical protein n=1 Tax=Nocardia beijingensis TaxID=95162 RepID=UPI001894FFA7|nr:hypothetical protein [Nocardia beijingensis]